MSVARVVPVVCLVVLTCLSAAPAGAQVPTFDAFYVFGDSLADNGNDLIASRLMGAAPPVPPSSSPHRMYFDGRFSNGPVAVEYLWALLAPAVKLSPTVQPFMGLRWTPRHRSFDLRLERKGAVNFAFGGSGTGLLEPTPGGLPVPGLRGQIALFATALAGKKPSPRALYVIIAGAGDYLRDVPLSPAASVGNIATAVRQLYALGARDILVMNLPDLGQVPLTVNTPASGALSALTAAHNAGLAMRVDELRAALPKATVVLIDVAEVMSELPPSVNVTVPAIDTLMGVLPQGYPPSVCLFVDPATCPNAPTFGVGLGFLFWDAEHPTTAVHEQLARVMYAALR